MMNRKPCQLRVRIDTSASDSEVLFEERLSPDFLELSCDDELSADSEIEVSGKAYRAAEWVMVEAYVTACLTLPCALCNERCDFPIERMFWEQSIPVSEVKDGVLDLSGPLREAILLEVPFFIRCGGDTCRNIDEVRKYLRSEDSPKTDDGEEKNQPFLTLL